MSKHGLDGWIVQVFKPNLRYDAWVDLADYVHDLQQVASITMRAQSLEPVSWRQTQIIP